MKIQFLLVLTVFSTALRLFSQPGTLDVSFGDKGKVIATTKTGFPAPASAVLLKDNNKILVGSYEYINGTSVFLQKQFFNNGVADTTFGINGEQRTDFGNGVGGQITAMSTTYDKKIFAIGIGGLDQLGNRGADILLAKYNYSGTLDSSFGINGLVVADFGLSEFANCMTLLDNNKILVGGSSLKNFGSKNNFFIARFNEDGSVDSSFGNNGKVITDIDPSYGSVINALAVHSDGSIIVTGTAQYLSGQEGNKIQLAKYSADGKFDKSFGSNGLVSLNPSDGEDDGNAVLIQEDGKIVIAGGTGLSYPNQSGMCIARFNPDGKPDKSFNKTGVLIIYFGDDNSVASSLIIDSKDNYVLGGTKSPSGFTPNLSDYDFALASVTKDGFLNSSFGMEGITTTDFYGLSDYCSAIVFQPDGKIVAAGGSNDSLGTIGYITLARYNSNTSKKQIIITKISRWLQHHNGFTWDANSSISSYAVQRSYDGIHFNSIARIHAGNTSNYTYQDPMPLSGNNYYRLQTTSADGSVNYSNVLAVSNQPSAISISPNPAKNELQIQGLPSNQKIKLSVINFSGNEKMQAVANPASYNLNIASLKAGNYLLKIEMDGEVVCKKFVKE